MHERISFLASCEFCHYIFRARWVPAIAGDNRKIIGVCYDIKNVFQATTIRNQVQFNYFENYAEMRRCLPIIRPKLSTAATNTIIMN